MAVVERVIVVLKARSCAPWNHSCLYWSACFANFSCSYYSTYHFNFLLGIHLHVINDQPWLGKVAWDLPILKAFLHHTFVNFPGTCSPTYRTSLIFFSFHGSRSSLSPSSVPWGLSLVCCLEFSHSSMAHWGAAPNTHRIILYCSLLFSFVTGCQVCSPHSGSCRWHYTYRLQPFWFLFVVPATRYLHFACQQFHPGCRLNLISFS